MDIIRVTKNTKKANSPCVATIGNFDGVHLGHQALLVKVKEKAQQLGRPSAAVTFEPQPHEFFLKNVAPVRLSLFRDKIFYLQEHGINRVYSISFNATLAAISAEDFVKEFICNKMNIQYLVVGDDFKFGNAREGDYHLLKKMSLNHHFKVDSIDSVLQSKERISSSVIRQAIEMGQFSKAKMLLGHDYSISGRVVYGNQWGRKFGFPTANIPLQRRRMPVHGIYVVKVSGLSQGVLEGVASVGTRPTVDGKHMILEVFIFDFDEDIYGQRIQVHFLDKLRDEIKFPTVDEMIQQIKEDVKLAKQYLKRESYERE